MSVGIVTTCYGPDYYGFLDEWSGALLELNSEPDWVTIVHDGVPDDLRSKVDDRLSPVWVTDKTPVEIHPQSHINTGIAVTFTDWILKVDVDDLLLPHALDGWQNLSADIVNFGYSINGAAFPSRKVTAEWMLEKQSNPIGSCSPFRRWVWESNRFQDLGYDDWAFWILAAQVGAVFDATGRIDYVWRQHPAQITNRIDHGHALDQIRRL